MWKELNNSQHEKDNLSLDVINATNNESGNEMRPRQVLTELDALMPSDAILSMDIANLNSVTRSELRVEYSAAPDAGNGAWDMNEIMTCMRHNVSVIVVVFHNHQWATKKKN